MGFFKENESISSKILKVTGIVIGGLAMATLMGFVFGLLVMWLWNWLMPELFGLKVISFWQAWGLVVLSHILIKPGYGAPGKAEGPKGRKKDFKCEPDSEVDKNASKGETPDIAVNT